MKKSDFDILKNADDDTIEKLSSFTDEDEAVKMRIFEMSEKKYEEMVKSLSEENGSEMNEENTEKNENRETENETYGVSTDDIEMSVVNGRKIKWWKPALCAAASLAVVAAGVLALDYNGTQESDPYLSDNDDLFTYTEQVTAPSATPLPSPIATSVPSVKKLEQKMITTEYTPAPPEEKVLVKRERKVLGSPDLKEEERKKIFENILTPYIETLNFSTSDHIDSNAESIKFLSNRYSPTDGCDYEQAKIGDNDVYYLRYYKIGDPRFNSVKEIKSYYGQFFTHPSDLFNGYKFGSDFSGFGQDDALTHPMTFPLLNDVITYNGDLYSVILTKKAFEPEGMEIIRDRSYDISEGKFLWERLYRTETDEGTKLYYITFLITKNDKGVWKATICKNGYSDYDPNVNYSALYYPEAYPEHTDCFSAEGCTNALMFAYSSDDEVIEDETAGKENRNRKTASESKTDKPAAAEQIKEEPPAHSEEEIKVIYEKGLSDYIETFAMLTPERIDSENSVTTENLLPSYSNRVTYDKYLDTRFKSVDDVRNYLAERYTDPENVQWILSSYKTLPESVLFERFFILNVPDVLKMFYDYDGSLYVKEETEYFEECRSKYENLTAGVNGELISETSYQVENDSFCHQRIYRFTKDGKEMVKGVGIKMARDTDGRWKIVSAASTEYKYVEGVDYTLWCMVALTVELRDEQVEKYVESQMENDKVFSDEKEFEKVYLEITGYNDALAEFGYTR